MMTMDQDKHTMRTSSVFNVVRSPCDKEVCIVHYRACDVWLAGWRGDFATLYLAQSSAPVPYGIDANESNKMDTESEFLTHDS
jgi:hypothetical protein